MVECKQGGMDVVDYYAKSVGFVASWRIMRYGFLGVPESVRVGLAIN